MICNEFMEILVLSLSFSKEIGRLGVWAWPYPGKDGQKILTTCTQKKFVEMF